VVAAYIADRLLRETQERGAKAAIARAIGFTRAHVSSVAHGQAGVGEDFVDAIAKYWGTSYDALQREAEAWAERDAVPPSAGASRGRLRDRPEWPQSLAAAKSVFTGIPDGYFADVGALYDDVPGKIDAQFVGDLARIRWELAQRTGQEPPRSGATSSKKRQ